MPFAILIASGQLGIMFGILPKEIALDAAIQWAWSTYQGSSDAMALSPEDEVMANFGRYILERWDTELQATA